MHKEEADSDERKEVSHDNHSNKRSAINMNSDGKVSQHEDKSIMHEKNTREKYQCTFEMIDNIANTMKILENAVVDHYSDSEKSEKLSERQQKRLERLK